MRLEVGLWPCFSSSNLANGQTEKNSTLSDYSTDTETESLQLLCQPTGRKFKTPMSTTLTSSFIETKTSLLCDTAIAYEFGIVFGNQMLVTF